MTDQDRIESLRIDLLNLQGAAQDVFSRTGPVHFSSWKFPDQLSCNLDMVALLEQYDYVDGEDELNEQSHIMLLELMIDRLLHLLQSFNAYVEQIRGNHLRDQSQQRGCLSVGLVVRNYWSNLIKFAKFKGIYRDVDKAKTCVETQSESSVCQQTRSKSCLSPFSSKSSSKFSPDTCPNFSPVHTTTWHPKTNCQNVGCQTFESSLVPCDACHQVQSVLRKTGDALVEIFQSEGLPSSLQPLLTAVEELGLMTAGDVAQWATVQSRDMRRLTKHLQDVRATVQPLKEGLMKAEVEREQLRSQLEQVQRKFRQDVDKHQANIVQLEFSLQKAQRCVKQIEQKLQEEQKQHKKETVCLVEENSKLKEEVTTQQNTIQAIEHEKDVVQDKVKTLQEACCELQERIQNLEAQISETNLCLDKEKAKYYSAFRQQEAMQAKQQSLLKRVDVLDQECEELIGQIEEWRDKHHDLQHQLQEMSEEKEQVQAQLAEQQILHNSVQHCNQFQHDRLSNDAKMQKEEDELCSRLQKEKQRLEANMTELQNSVAELKEQVLTLKERERLLVAFPELSPMVNPQSTGSVLLDMEKQLQANGIRIKVLEQENTTLHSSLVKLRQSAQRNASKEASSQRTQGPSLLSTQAERQQSHDIQMSLHRSHSIHPGSSDGRNEAGQGECGWESADSEFMISPPAVLPQSLQLHVQTVHLKLGSKNAKSHMKTSNASLLSHKKGSGLRRK